MMDSAATGQQLSGPFSQESLSCGLSQRICGVRWMLCTCDARGSILPRPLFQAQAFFLTNPTMLHIHSRQSCEERMFPPTQTSRQAAAPGSSSPPTVMLWNAVYGKPSLTACGSLKSAQAGSWRQHFKTLIYWFIVSFNIWGIPLASCSIMFKICKFRLGAEVHGAVKYLQSGVLNNILGLWPVELACW